MLSDTMSMYVVFVAFLAIYAVLQRSSRTLMLVYVTLFSLAFNYYLNREMAGLLPLTAFVSWAMTNRMSLCEGALRRRWVWFIVVVQLMPLVYFKYVGACVGCIAGIFDSNTSFGQVVLPVGISFYTFQAISHTVDVYRSRLPQQMDFLEYMFYLSFFPLLLSGPVTRSSHLLPQMRRPLRIDRSMLYTGLWLVMSGLIKKCVFADYIGQYSVSVFDQPELYGGFELLMGVLGYSIQIYCDFSGYSDIAIGVAAMMGFELRENFKFPYRAVNISEFWRRWHISLSAWFRDYVYIPLGGSHGGAVRTGLNLMITMLLVGVWHGCSVMFLAWGALHGVGLALHRYLRLTILDRIPNRWYVVVISWIVFQTFMMLTWIVFRSDNVGVATDITTRIFTDFDGESIPAFIRARGLWVALLAAAFLIHGIGEAGYDSLQRLYIRLPWIVKLLILICVVQIVVVFASAEVKPFIYYRF